MREILTGTAVVAALALGATAHASCADPRATAQQGLFQLLTPTDSHGRSSRFETAAENIVGTWHVVYTPDGSTTPSGMAFIQWHSDGTEWENINYPVLGGNICLGSWKAIDHSHVFRNHYGWLFNNGMLAGWFNETETDEVAWDGNSYTGLNQTTLHFYPVPPATTGMTVVLNGTAAATRLEP
jgi:hypothetical protein